MAEKINLDLEVVKWKVPVYTDSNPTLNQMKFAVVATDTEPVTGDFVNGSWSGSFDAVRKRTYALTPSIGGTSSGAGIELGAAGVYDVWAMQDDGVTNPVSLIDTITAY